MSKTLEKLRKAMEKAEQKFGDLEGKTCGAHEAYHEAIDAYVQALEQEVSELEQQACEGDS